MSLWSARRPAYKLAVLGQLGGFLLYVSGFSTPFWFYASPHEGSQGLWQYCNGRCHKLDVEEDWFELVRAVLCMALIMYPASCVLAFYDNCLTKHDPLATHRPARRVEVVTAIAGLLGTTGMAVYTVMMKVQYKEYTNNQFGGSYFATATACGLALLLTAVLLATGRVEAQVHV